MNLSRYYSSREPTDVFRIAGFPRLFVAYDPRILDSLSARLKSGMTPKMIYVSLCETALAGTETLAALPKDSPPWHLVDGKWRPMSAAGAGSG